MSFCPDRREENPTCFWQYALHFSHPKVEMGPFEGMWKSNRSRCFLFFLLRLGGQEVSKFGGGAKGAIYWARK